MLVFSSLLTLVLLNCQICRWKDGYMVHLEGFFEEQINTQKGKQSPKYLPKLNKETTPSGKPYCNDKPQREKVGLLL